MLIHFHQIPESQNNKILLCLEQDLDTGNFSRLLLSLYLFCTVCVDDSSPAFPTAHFTVGKIQLWKQTLICLLLRCASR